MKHSKLLYGFITVLGIVFLTTFLTILYLSVDGSEMLHLLQTTRLMGDFVLFCLFGGTVFLTVGICGVERQYFKNNRSLFTILTAISIPSFILIPFFYYWFSALEVGF